MKITSMYLGLLISGAFLGNHVLAMDQDLVESSKVVITTHPHFKEYGADNSMVDHFSVAVKDYEKSVEFYDESLKILGYKRLNTLEVYGTKLAGYGRDIKSSFWITSKGLENEEIGMARGFHFAFSAQDEKSVQEWYKKCLELGGKDNGSPGIRAQYHPGYYGAYIIDPNGWRIEACFHNATGTSK